jgi:hypothetical protein
MNCWQANKVLLLVATFLLALTQLLAQTKPIVEYAGKREIKVMAGKEETISLAFSIIDDFYIQGHELENEYFIPTVLNITPSEHIVVGKLQYPPAIKYSYTDDAVLDIYKKEMVISLPIQVIDSLAGASDLYLTGSLYYQACSKVKCYYPRTLDFTVKIKTKTKQVVKR